jgi:D-tyrosyl-tRNA(Tyr) deacylase
LEPMIAIIQRAKSSKVEVNGQLIGRIGPGLNCLLGVEKGDTREDLKWLCDKIVHLRIFEDDQGKMSLSLLDTGGGILVIPQFTLLGDCRKGRRPNFTRAAAVHEAREFFNEAIEHLRKYPIEVAQGLFQAHMMVHIENDGPVTFIINSKERSK